MQSPRESLFELEVGLETSRDSFQLKLLYDGSVMLWLRCHVLLMNGKAGCSEFNISSCKTKLGLKNILLLVVSTQKMELALKSQSVVSNVRKGETYTSRIPMIWK